MPEKKLRGKPQIVSTLSNSVKYCTFINHKCNSTN